MQPIEGKEGRRGDIVVVGGKGGVGKTSISAMLVKLFLREGKSFLVIDADPVISLAYALGEKPKRTIGDYRQGLIESSEEQQSVFKKPLKAIIREMLVQSQRGYDLLALGRSEGKGCFCGINDMLRYAIESLCGEYEITLIDCEAGIEQVNRRAVHRIDKLILVTDTSQRGVAALAQIRDIAVKYNEGHPLEVKVIVNRIRNESEDRRVRAIAAEFGLEVVGYIPEDPIVREYNLREQPLLDLPDNSLALQALNEIMRKFYT